MSDEPWVYFDGNAVSKLWDWYTKVTGEGQTGDARDATPFQHVVFSDYSLDELITIPIGNAYKKHVMLLAIFPGMPVLMALEHADIDGAIADRTGLVRPAEYLHNATTSRLAALAGHPESLAALNADIDNKLAAIRSRAAGATGRYVPTTARVSFEHAIAETVAVGALQPADSAIDFFQLCQRLYVLDVARYIDRPSRHRKGPTRLLNQQIDYYHLSYLPFVQGFVTDDIALLEMAETLAGMFCPGVDIYDVESYHRRWITDTLMRK